MTRQREATAPGDGDLAEVGYRHSAPILMVEDNAADIRLTREALADARLCNSLAVVTDGEKAIAYLRHEPPYEDVARPGLVLLDLNLPRLDGREVLKIVKSDPELLSIPVLVLTTSAASSDVEVCYRRHANGFVTKPVTFDDLIRAMRKLGDFWFDLVTLPPDPRR